MVKRFISGKLFVLLYQKENNMIFSHGGLNMKKLSIGHPVFLSY